MLLSPKKASALSKWPGRMSALLLKHSLLFSPLYASSPRDRQEPLQTFGFSDGQE